MHRLTVFKKYIVCYIDNIVDRSYTARTKSFLHPTRWRADFNVFNHSCTVSLTLILVLYINADCIGDIFTVFVKLNFRNSELFIKWRRCFTCKTDYAETIRSVWSDFKFNDSFIHTEYILNIRTDFCIVRKNKNTVFRFITKHILCYTKFIVWAKHTVRFNASKLAFFNFSVRKYRTDKCNGNDYTCFYIRRTADNLQRFAAGIDLQQVQVVGIRMHFAFFHFGGGKTRKLCRRVNHFFHFQPDAGQGFGNFIHGRRRVQMFFQPG